MSGVHVVDDSLELAVLYCPQPALVMYAVLLDPGASSGCDPFALGVGEIPAVGLHCVAPVPRSEERRTCCHLREVACPSLKYGGMVPPCLAECLQG